MGIGRSRRTKGRHRSTHRARSAFVAPVVLMAALFAGAGGSLVAAAGTAGAAQNAATQGNRALGIVKPTTVTGAAVGGSAKANPVNKASTRYPATSYPCGPLGAGCGTLVYHTGPVMGTPAQPGSDTIYPIFWSPPGYSFSPRYEQLIKQYLRDVAATDGRPTNNYSSSNQYYEVVNGVKQHVRYDVHDGGAIRISTPIPNTGNGCTATGTDTACVSDAQIHTMLSALLAKRGLPSDLAHIYLVYFPQRVETCIYTSGATYCSAGAKTNVQYCAYHSWFGGTPLAGGTPTPPLYGNMPYPYHTTVPGTPECAVPPTESPNHTLEADTAISITSHETIEALTDPEFTGWWNPRTSQEIGDQCAYLFGTPLGGTTFGGTPGNAYNQVINGDTYYTQLMWSNENNRQTGGYGCVGAANIPTARYSVYGQSYAGWSLAFTAASSYNPDAPTTAMTYTWTFGDRSQPASGEYVSHTFGQPGRYKVKLTVADADGWSNTTTQIQDVFVK